MNPIITDDSMTKKSHRYSEFRRRLDKLDKKLVTHLNYEKAAQFLVKETVDIFGADAGILFLEKQCGHGMILDHHYGLDETPKDAVVLKKRDSLWKILQNGHSVIQFGSDTVMDNKLNQSRLIQQLPANFMPSLILKLTFNGYAVGMLMLAGDRTHCPSDMLDHDTLSKLGERAGLTLQHALMYYAIRKESLEKSLLLETSKRISSSLDLQEVLNLIIDSLKQVVPYDKAMILLLNPKTREIEMHVHRSGSYDPQDDLKLRPGEGISSCVAETGKPMITPDVRKSKRYYSLYPSTRSEMDVPLLRGKEVIGIFNLESNTLNAYTEQDLSLLQAFAGQAAVAIENARLYQQMVEKREYEKELEVSKKFQKALLPKRPPQADKYLFGAMNIPSRLVGGDLYDFISFGDERIGICIGDVSGKGTPGAILMATLYATYRGLVRSGKPLDLVMYDLNNFLKKRSAAGSFATFFYGDLHLQSRTLTYCNAGHNAPILLRADNQIERLEKGGTVLGFMENLPFETGSISLHNGDLLFLFTDGLTESQNPREDMYGEERLFELLTQHRHLQPSTFLRKIYRDVKNFARIGRPQDDFTTLVVKVD